MLVLTFLVALLYSSVGHGGASGYLAVLALFGFTPDEMRSSALLLNLLVAGVAFANYFRAGHFERRLFWPFALSSIPFAFIGGRSTAPPKVYAALLAAALAFAAFRLIMPSPETGRTDNSPPSAPLALALGAAIGLLSGLVGVGGGIFLSPLMILLGWADARRTAAVSAAFIWVNSAAGLLGQASRFASHQPLTLWPLALAALAGGLIGSRAGARSFTPLLLRRVLGVVLLTAALKLGRIALGA